MQQPPQSPSMPPPTTRTNVDTLAVTAPAPMDSSRARPGPWVRLAATWLTSTITPITAMNARAEPLPSRGVT